MKKSDKDKLQALNREAYAKAVTAAALALRTDERVDRAMVAMPKLRDRIAEFAALHMIGCEPREPASGAELAELARNRQFELAYRLARDVALEAVAMSLKGIDLVPLPKSEAA